MKGQVDIFDELSVVLFAGGGGSDTGISCMTGRPVDIAINHDIDAIRMHMTNHPYTRHLQEDVFAVDPDEVCGGRRVGVMWASPDCTFYSRARGGKPIRDEEKRIRGLSWVVIKWALSSAKPRVMFMENVPEIQEWGPCILTKKGWQPDPARKGETYKGFIAMLTTGIEPGHPALLECCEFLRISPDGPEAKRLICGLGYDFDCWVLCAADYGVPTIRKRWYAAFRCDGRAIVKPAPTHSKGGVNGLKPWVPAASIIDWSIPSPSIFANKKEIKKKYGINAVRPLAENTQKRAIRGVDKFTIKSANPFIVETNHTSNVTDYDCFRGGDINEPLGTITATHGRGICKPVIVPIGYGERPGQEPRIHDVDEPLPTIVGSGKHYLAEPVMAPFTMSNVSNAAGTDAREPVNTARTSGGCGQMLCEAGLTPFTIPNTTNCAGSPANNPVHTITSAGNQLLVTPSLMAIGQTGGGDRISSTAGPVNTQVSKAETCVITPSLIQYHSEKKNEYVRGQSLDDTLMTVDTANRYGFVSAQLTEYFGNGRPIPVTDPMHTVTALPRESLTLAQLSEFRGADVGCQADMPLRTVASHDHQALTMAHVHKYYDGGYTGCGSDVNEPLGTVTAQDHNALCTSHVIKFKGTNLGQSPLDPLQTITSSSGGGSYGTVYTTVEKYGAGIDLKHWPKIRALLNKYCGYSLADDEVILIWINGVAYYIADIGLRMLTPRELYNAMGFPTDYIIDRDYTGRAYIKSAQVARCGNAVCPPVAGALVRANLAEYALPTYIVTMAELWERVEAV